MHEKGKGVNINAKKAYKLYIKIARKGHTEAQFRVANMYAKGTGVEKSLSKSKYWLKKLIEKGDDRAKKMLNQIN
jgi:TPR repeat protein